MRNKIIFAIAFLGLLAGVVSAYVSGVQPQPSPPVFRPAPNPYATGIYTNGIIESDQTNGENITIYPEVAGTITHILVTEGETVQRGTPLLRIDDSVQQALVEQQQAQADAALTLLDALKAQPRPENLQVAIAQVTLARANLKSTQDQLSKQAKSFALDPKSVSADTLDTATNAVKVAQANLEVVQRQYDLVKAGAWSYDIRNQERQYGALVKAQLAANALLAKYTITAPTDGVILSIKAAVGSYISPQGTYGTYTGGLNPVVIMGSAHTSLAVRCYIDEILIHRLPEAARIRAHMFIRGTNIDIPLDYVRVQPYVTPKIQLSNQRSERVDVRVLPVLFRFTRPPSLELYPGQLVDVYVGDSTEQQP